MAMKRILTTSQREQLLSVEEERISGSKQYTIDELDQILEAVIQGYREY